jgi:transposase
MVGDGKQKFCCCCFDCIIENACGREDKQNGALPQKGKEGNANQKNQKVSKKNSFL